MTTAALWGLVIVLTLLSLVLAIAGFWVEHYLERERARRVLREAEQRVERRGSVAEFYRLSGTLDKHRRKWAA